jgi:hypothetical protein
VVLGSTLTGLSCGGGGAGTDVHLSTIDRGGGTKCWNTDRQKRRQKPRRHNVISSHVGFLLVLGFPIMIRALVYSRGLQ